MSKILRKTAVIFGGAQVAGPNGIGQFGSLSGGTPAYSLDPGVIQALGAWAQGWGAALVSNFPAQEDMNSVDYVNSYNTAYLLQQGISEYDADTPYFIDSFVSYNGQVYQSITDDNLGNLPTDSANWKNFKSGVFWGGTDAGAINAFTLTAISGFPANADIPVGTILAGVASTSNTGNSTLAVNAQANISILDSDGFGLEWGMITKGMTFVLIFNGTKWNLVNKKKDRRSWKLFGDWSGASPAVKATGIGNDNFALTGTGATYDTVQPYSMNVPNVAVKIDNTSGHVATLTVPTNCLQIFPLMNLYMDIGSLLATHDAQSFVGYASGAPVLNGSDPLANLTGWGIWSKWTSGLLTDVKLVNNDGGANSTITAMVTGVPNSSEMFIRIIKETALITASVIIGAVQTTVTSNTDIPPVTAPSSSQVVAPYVSVRTNAAFIAEQSIGEIYGEYGL